MFHRVFPPMLCLILGAGTVADLFDGVLYGVAFIAVGALEIVAVEALGSRLRPRHKGRGATHW